MVLVDHTAPVAARTRSSAQVDETEMKRSASFAGTVNIGLALGDQNKQKPLPDWRDLILPGCYGALAGLAMSVRASWASCAAGLGLLLCAGPPLLSSTYTIWNCTALIAQLCDAFIRIDVPPRLLPYLLVNSWAIFFSFNVMAILYPSHYRELATRIDASMPYFHFLNTLGHFVPGLLCWWWFDSLANQQRIEACAWTHHVPVAYASCLFHVAWAFRVAGGLLLDHVYLKRPRFQWYVAWATGTCVHLYVGRVVAAACASGNSLSNSL